VTDEGIGDIAAGSGGFAMGEADWAREIGKLRGMAQTMNKN
jgi:hypothetical protein